MLALTCRRLRWLSHWAFLFILTGWIACGAQPKSYIPKDLYDCYVDLERILDPEMISQMKSSTAREMTRKYAQVEVMIKDRWELTRKSRLTNYFQRLGVRHPDEMTRMILKGYWHHLNDAPYQVSQIVTQLSGNR